MILDKIVDRKKIQIRDEIGSLSIKDWIQLIKYCDSSKKRGFIESIKKEKKISLIAEVKKASPSKGLIKEDFNPVEIARSYEENNATCISVLTEKYFFKGEKNYLRQVKKEVCKPILRKDFIIDISQIYESKYLGADAILLIAAILTKEQLKEYLLVANLLEMDCLVEVHNEEEMKKVLDTDARLIGINNRNLHTFEVNLETTARLADMVPKDRLIISESGIMGIDDIDFLNKIGVDGILVGELLMRSKDIKSTIKMLVG